jgi:phospholipid-binding lipoprotein MlaA
MAYANNFARIVLLPALVLTLSACASQGATDSSADESVEQPVRAEYDPWEPLNRGMYAFNDAVDRYTLRPIAKGYKAVVPTFARRGVTNFSQNLLTPRSAINNFLQGKPVPGMSDIGRFMINTVFGIGGLFDFATGAGLEVYDETFGQTLAVWGVPEGPFVYVPFLGPNTLLDAVSIPVDIASDPLFHYDNSSVKDKLYILRTIDLRARLLTAETLLEDSKDPYLTIRESYLQNRRFRVYDGEPPSSEEDDDLFDEFFEEE